MAKGGRGADYAFGTGGDNGLSPSPSSGYCGSISLPSSRSSPSSLSLPLSPIALSPPPLSSPLLPLPLPHITFPPSPSLPFPLIHCLGRSTQLADRVECECKFGANCRAVGGRGAWVGGRGFDDWGRWSVHEVSTLWVGPCLWIPS